MAATTRRASLCDDVTSQAAGAAGKSAAAHARFAKAVLLVYLGASSIAIALLVVALLTDRNHDEDQTVRHLQLETQVRASYLGQHMALLVDELQRLGLRSEVNLLDLDTAPERRLLDILHANGAFFNLGVAVVDLEGTVQWAEPAKFLPPKTSLANKPWFMQAEQNAEASIVAVDPESTDAVVFVISPVIRDGQFTGALVGGVDLARDRPIGQDTAATMTVLATTRGSVVYPPVPPHFALTHEWTELFDDRAKRPYPTEARLDDVPTVVAAAPIGVGDLVLLSLANRDALFLHAKTRLRTRLLLGLGLALTPLLALVLLLQRSFREFRRSEAQAVREERLQRIGEATNLIAHEVKNSLNGLKMGLDLVLQRKQKPSERVVAELRAEIDRLGSFTHQLMLFAKDPVPRRTGIDLSELLPKALGLWLDVASELDVAIETRGADQPIPVEADPVLLQIAISNLVSNALDSLAGAPPDEPARIVVGVEQEPGRVVVRVTDNGPGVAEELRDTLFEPFVTGKPSGVGIGLAMARKVALAHGGDSGARSGRSRRPVRAYPGAEGATLVRATVLVVDDERVFRVMAEEALVGAGFEVTTAATLARARAALAHATPDVVILDRRLPDGDGLDLLTTLRSEGPAAPLVIVVTAYGDVENAVQALRAGAADYLTKPLQVADLLVKLDRTFEARGLRERLALAQSRVARPPLIEGKSTAERAMHADLANVAASPLTPVLLVGPSGAGKQCAAERLHNMTYADADSAPFVDVNCAALPAELVESELFGHEKGAFTDARSMRRGVVELANHGTLFLDEVTELPERSQAKLLKFLDTMRFRRVGGEREIDVELRIVAATNQDIARMATDGRFRADLYHRLSVFTIAVPALADRREDIPGLADTFVRFFAGRLRKRISGLTPGARALLQGYDYPGNVRELRNIIERAVILARDSELTERDLVLPGASVPEPLAGDAFFSVVLDRDGAPPTAEQVEHEYVRRVLAHFDGRRMQAAQALGLSYPTFLRRLREFGIDR